MINETAENTVMESSKIEMSLTEKYVNKISDFFKDEEFGFEVYIVMKDSNEIKRFILDQGNPQERLNEEKNFKRKIQNAILNSIRDKYLGENAKYDEVANVSDNQKNFYVIEQDDDYKPFGMTLFSVEELDSLENYSENERENAEGVLFAFFRGDKSIWAYQHLYENAIPNRKGLGFHIFQQGDVFVEMKKPLLLLSRRIDILIVEGDLVTDKTDLLQKNFQFEEFVKVKAKRTVDSITTLDLIENIEKVTAYVERSRKIYARKMLRIKDSKVLQKTADELYKKVTTLPRWKNKFDINEEDKKIVLNTYEQVENLIDLLDERYTRSDVTDEEYDTGVKKWIAPVEG